MRERLTKRSNRPETYVDDIIERLSRIAVVTPGELTLDIVKDDPSDNTILACAVESEADFIIS